MNAASGFEGFEGAARAQIAEIFARAEPVYLLFSGGKESLTVLRFMEQYEGRFKLLWANTGFTFPHMEALIREKGERFGLVELNSNLMANCKHRGIPAEVVTMNSMWPGGTEMRLQPWLTCCYALRNKPVVDFMAAHDGPATFIRGQRKEDKAPGMGLEGLPRPDHVRVASPLADWSTDQVFAFVEAKGIELPAHYADIRNSLDCWVCPAHWGEEHGPALARYMTREYPEKVRTIVSGVHRIREAAREAIDLMGEALESRCHCSAVLRAAAPALRLRDRTGDGDCMIASLATVTNLPYETIAAALGCPVDLTTGLPTKSGAAGLTVFDILPPLLDLGFAATPIFAPGVREFLTGDEDAFMRRREAEGVRFRFTDASTIKRLIRGRRAVLLAGNPATPVQNHAMAWKDGKLFDVDPRRDPHWRNIDDADLAMLGAVIIARMQA